MTAPNFALETSFAYFEMTPRVNRGAGAFQLARHDLAAGPVSIALDRDEAVVVPLSARDVTVTVDGTEHRLAGRDGVFAAVSDWLYVPLGSRLTLAAAGGEVAVCTARAEQVHPVPVHRRGRRPGHRPRRGRGDPTGHRHRHPDSFGGADRIMVCEVVTPGGNVSSWPPHRHDGLDAARRRTRRSTTSGSAGSTARTATPTATGCSGSTPSTARTTRR